VGITYQKRLFPRKIYYKKGNILIDIYKVNSEVFTAIKRGLDNFYLLIYSSILFWLLI